MQKPIMWIALGLIFLIVGIMNQPDTISLTVGLIFLICGIFLQLKYENKMVYRVLTSLILICMSILTYLQLFNPNYTGNVLFNGGIFVLVLIIGIFIIYKFPQDWKL